MRRPQERGFVVSLRRAALAALLGAFGVAAFGQACSTPSSSVDGSDLLGVFAHDASDDGSLDAARHEGVRKGAGADASAATASARDASVRVPTEGVCVAEEGQPNRELRRTLGRPACRGAQILEWKDAENSPRYACVFSPAGVETRAPLPLVIFFHDPHDDPTAIDKKTGLRKLSSSFSVTSDPAHTGFIVLAPQGRAIKNGKYGALFDSEYTGPDNADVAAVDHFVAELEAKGLVDKRRIFTLGASYGGHMAATFAMMRADRVAAFATYATDMPRAAWSCPGPPPPAMILYRACDGLFSCESVERWLRARDAREAETAWLRLGASGEEEPNCSTRNKCTPVKSEAHHHRWPKSREADVLAFFARHALSGR